MAGRFEPFLINPPRRLRTSKFRLNMSDPDSYASGDPALKGLPSRKKVLEIYKKEARKAAAKKGAKTRRKNKRVKIKVRRAKVKRTKVVARRKSGISHVAAVKRAKKAARTRRANMKGTTMAKRKGRRMKIKARRRKISRHATMRSQWFKPRRRIKRRGYATKRKRHMVTAYSHRGHLYTSPFAKKVWANHRLNPYRRNPFGEELMVMGANPRRRRKSRKRKYSSNPRRRYMARGRKRFSHNPISSVTHLMPMIAAGTAGALATKMIPRVIGVTSPMATYGTQAVVVLGGGYLADKFMGKSVSDGWIVGGATMILSNVLSGVLGGALAGLGLEYEAFPEMGAFPMGMLGEDSDLDNLTAVY